MGKVPARVLRRETSNSQANSDVRNSTEANRGGDDSGGPNYDMASKNNSEGSEGQSSDGGCAVNLHLKDTCQSQLAKVWRSGISWLPSREIELIESRETDCAKMIRQPSTKSDLAEGSSKPGRGGKRRRDSQRLDKVEGSADDEDKPGAAQRKDMFSKAMAELSTSNSSSTKWAHAYSSFHEDVLKRWEEEIEGLRNPDPANSNYQKIHERCTNLAVFLNCYRSHYVLDKKNHEGECVWPWVAETGEYDRRVMQRNN